MTTTTRQQTTTADTPDHFWGYDDDRKARNEDRARAAGLEPCTHCGRGVKVSAGWVTVVIEGGGTVAHPDSREAQDTAADGYMGAWVLGSTCAKGIPAGARAPWTGWDA